LPWVVFHITSLISISAACVIPADKKIRNIEIAIKTIALFLIILPPENVV